MSDNTIKADLFFEVNSEIGTYLWQTQEKKDDLQFHNYEQTISFPSNKDGVAVITKGEQEGGSITINRIAVNSIEIQLHSYRVEKYKDDSIKDDKNLVGKVKVYYTIIEMVPLIEGFKNVNTIALKKESDIFNKWMNEAVKNDKSEKCEPKSDINPDGYKPLKPDYTANIKTIPKLKDKDGNEVELSEIVFKNVSEDLVAYQALGIDPPTNLTNPIFSLPIRASKEFISSLKQK